MKKLAFLFVAVAAMSFASCGNGTQASEEATDTIDETVEEVCDTVPCDSVPADTVIVEEAE